MKDQLDPGTIDMHLPIKRGRGRPSTGSAKSAAERMRAYRSRHVTVKTSILEAALTGGFGSDMPTFPAWEAERQELLERIASLESVERELRAQIAVATRRRRQG